jgi:hypothetical protein
MFSAATVNHYGALKLQSTDGSPVAIDFGQSARADGELGLVEMTRKRIGEGLLTEFSEECPNCSGRGVVVDHSLLD